MLIDGETFPPNIQHAILCGLKEQTTIWVDGEEDGDRIVSWLLANGYTWCEGTTMTFDTCIATNRRLFSISIKPMPGVTVSVYNIRNMIPQMSRHEIVETFRAKTHAESIYNAVKFLDTYNISGPTASTAAMRDYRSESSYYKYFPDSKLWHGELADVYRGGIVSAKPGEYRDVTSYDCNSMYPTMLVNKPMPIGIPEHYDGQYMQDDNMPYHVDYLTVHVSPKRGMPDITHLYQAEDGYISTWLTDADIRALNIYGKVDVLESREGYKFKTARGLFRSYVEKWYSMKQHNTGAIRALAKLMENSLVGRFGVRSYDSQLAPYLDEDGDLAYSVIHKDESTKNYAPVAWWVTSLAREYLMTIIEKNIDNLIYTDTDSIVVKGHDVQGVKLGENLGEWKKEHYKKLRIIARRRYAYVSDDGASHNIIAGMPMNATIAYNDFKRGSMHHSSDNVSFML
jgi:hypothetical protein